MSVLKVSDFFSFSVINNRGKKVTNIKQIGAKDAILLRKKLSHLLRKNVLVLGCHLWLSHHKVHDGITAELVIATGSFLELTETAWKRSSSSLFFQMTTSSVFGKLGVSW